MTFDIRFNDSGREPKEKPDPRFPKGRDIDLRQTVIDKACCTNLPYPAPRCGSYSVRCLKCNWTGIITVAGRVDDPRTLTVACKVTTQ